MHKIIYILILFLPFTGCIEQFTPDIIEDETILVVEGMITDQPGLKTVKLSLSMPIGSKYKFDPLSGAQVSIRDEEGYTWTMYESLAGVYNTYFTGIVGRKYSLLINTNSSITNFHSYTSLPVEMVPVPPIDTIYYEKILVSGDPALHWTTVEACQIYLDAYDKSGQCRQYRWEYEETWEFRLPYEVPNKTCWTTARSSEINIKSTSVLSDSRVSRYPIRYITNETDRLAVNYSILVKQYSLSADEFEYWEKMKNLTQNVGGLYDLTPASFTGNILCIDDPTEKVLGYFSVSAESSKRFFVKERFSGQRYFYGHCPNDTIWEPNPPPGPGAPAWVIENHGFPNSNPGYYVITYYMGCADCTVRGTNIKPPFWVD